MRELSLLTPLNYQPGRQHDSASPRSLAGNWYSPALTVRFSFRNYLPGSSKGALHIFYKPRPGGGCSQAR